MTDLAMVVIPMLQCFKLLLPCINQACRLKNSQQNTHIRLKNTKRKGMPSHSLPSLAHTHTLRLSILHEGLELLLPEFQTAIFVKVSCQSVP